MINLPLIQINCPNCSKEIYGSEEVFIDTLNGLSHIQCGSPNIKDYGTYREIAKKYPYFYDKFYFILK